MKYFRKLVTYWYPKFLEKDKAIPTVKFLHKDHPGDHRNLIITVISEDYRIDGHKVALKKKFKLH